MDSGAVLIVEDEAVVALDLKLQLLGLGYTVTGMAASSAQALALAEARVPDLVLMDVRLQGPTDGIETARLLRERYGVPLIFLTSYSDDETVRRAAGTAPYGYLTKPYQLRELRAGIEVALTKARMERQLREADRWFAQTLHCVTDGVVLTDRDGRVRFLNPAAEAMTGWLGEDAQGRSLDAVVALAAPAGSNGPADLAQWLSQVRQDGRPLPVVHGLPLRAADGRLTPVDASAGPVDDAAGSPLGAVLVLRDATSRLAHEAQLRAEEARFRSAVDHAPLGMALVSLAGDFLQVNDALCRLLARSRQALQSASNPALTDEADRAHEALRLRALAGEAAGVVQFEKRYLRPGDVAPVWVLVSASLLREHDQPACYLYQVHDLTEQKRAAEHLAALAEERLKREASELASLRMREFLSRVSHEMRTPLNAVMGLSHLLKLQEHALEGAQVNRYADLIHESGRHLLGLVTDLLDLNRMAEGTLTLDCLPLDLAGLIDTTLPMLQPEADAHGLSLVAAVPSGLRVLADAQRLRQVLLNVIGNAIKYNRAGGSVHCLAAVLADGEVALSIEDTGIGMTDEQQARLYRPFDRLGAERTAVPGTGLGLVIARDLMVQMGGTLRVVSRPRQGTTVTLLLRAAG